VNAFLGWYDMDTLGKIEEPLNAENENYRIYGTLKNL
jgi:hypothetical protein